MNLDELTETEDETEIVLDEADEIVDVDISEQVDPSDPLKVRRDLENYFEEKRLRQELDYLLEDTEK